ncbi:MAG: hypothetical protein WCV85_00080 [Patescibacteria group bacterium]
MQDAPTVHVFLLNTFFDSPTNIGMTVREDGTVLFLDAIADLARNDPSTTNAYILSTLLHEFGHQLGLENITSADCIMAASVEEPTPLEGRRIATPTEYCQQELQLIEATRQIVK